MWKWLWVVLPLIILCLPATNALADTSEDITITATGWVCGAPDGFTLTYISDYEVGVSWTKGESAENTMVRGAVGRIPESRTDGYLVYYGDGEYATDTGVNLDETLAPVHYWAWSQNENGVWEEEGAGGFIEGIGVLNACLIGLALGISSLALWKRHMFLYLAGFIGCLTIGLYLVDVHPAFGPPLFILGAYMLWRAITWWF